MIFSMICALSSKKEPKLPEMELTEEEITQRLEAIHAKLDFVHGSIDDELPEQRMAVRFLKGTEKVLELGGNVGRNSCIIASILNEKNNWDYVVLESDSTIAAKLDENRQRNSLSFYVEPYALSVRPLVQSYWYTHAKTGDETADWQDIATITYKDLQEKYAIPFDTLIIDCEGCFYPILRDMPEIMEHVNLVLVENDYTELTQKFYVESELKKRGFSCVYSEGNGFYEAWKKVDCSPPSLPS